MRVINQPHQSIGPTVVTIGNFDGVHRGHLALIEQAKIESGRLKLPLAALTFEPHPAAVLRGSLSNFLLSPGTLKYELLEQTGVDVVRVLPFTPDFARMDPDAFLDQILARDLEARHVVVGYNFTFGHKGSGDAEKLAAWGRHQGVGIDIVGPFRVSGGEAVSSSLIRGLVAHGEVAAARELLGHPFRVAGLVQRGDQRGRKLGAPTLNLEWPENQVAPPYGIYAGFAQLEQSEPNLMAVASYGVRPTFGDNAPLFEIHVLEGLPQDQYGRRVAFDFLYRLRDEIKFDSPEDLAEQIRLDVEKAVQLLRQGA